MLRLTNRELNWIASLGLGNLAKVKQFEGAITNQVFLLTFENSLQFIFKRLNSKARNWQKREIERAINNLASDKGISPEIIAQHNQLRIQSYIEGELVNSKPVFGNNIELLASQLQLIHHFPAKFALSQSLVNELQTLKKCSQIAIDPVQFDHYFQLACQLDQTSAKNTLCHGDLSFNNLIKSKNGNIVILDWEYAVLACPAYDLGACAAINGLSDEQQVQLIENYYALQPEKEQFSLAELQAQSALYRQLFNYLNSLWESCFD